MAFKKTVQEKLQTKLNTLAQYDDVSENENSYQVDDDVLLQVSDTELIYGKTRFSPTSTSPLWEDNYSVTLVLSHENLTLVNSNPINPPKGAKNVFEVFKSLGNTIKNSYRS